MKITDCRPEVQAFAIAMEKKLRENDHKTHWRKCAVKYLRRRLAEELIELDDAEHPEDVAAECVDVANFAMMIADNKSRCRRAAT
jgi:hypothetical protein